MTNEEADTLSQMYLLVGALFIAMYFRPRKPGYSQTRYCRWVKGKGANYE